MLVMVLDKTFEGYLVTRIKLEKKLFITLKLVHILL